MIILFVLVFYGYGSGEPIVNPIPYESEKECNRAASEINEITNSTIGLVKPWICAKIIAGK